MKNKFFVGLFCGLALCLAFIGGFANAEVAYDDTGACHVLASRRNAHQLAKLGAARCVAAHHRVASTINSSNWMWRSGNAVRYVVTSCLNPSGP